MPCLAEKMAEVSYPSDYELERLWKRGQPLTRMNRVAISGLARGLTAKDIAAESEKSVGTIRNQIKDAMMRSGSLTAAGTILYALFGESLSKAEVDSMLKIEESIPISVAQLRSLCEETDDDDCA